MIEIESLFVDLWVLLTTVWSTLRTHRGGFTLLLLLFCALMAGLGFNFWLVLALVLLVGLAVFLQVLLPSISDKQQKFALYAVLALIVVFGLYGTWVLLGWLVAIIVLAGLIYFGFFAK